MLGGGRGLGNIPRKRMEKNCQSTNGTIVKGYVRILFRYFSNIELTINLLHFTERMIYICIKNNVDFQIS
jgi:hypothetical protein